MILDSTLRSTVIAAHHRPRIAKLLRHRLRVDGAVEVAELRLHVHDGLLADRAFVRRLHVRVVAVSVDGVAATHEHDRLRGGEHVLPADGAVTVGGALDAFVGLLHGDVHAEAAFLWTLE